MDSGLDVPVFLPRDDPIASTIQDGRVTVQQVQGRQDQSSSLGTIGNATTSKGNNAAGQAREKLMMVEAQESGQVLDEEQLAFLADPGITNCHVVQPTIIHNVAFQTDDLDAYDSDCDDISSAKAILMANLLSYGLDVLSKVPQPDTHQNNNMFNQSVQETQYFEQSLIDYVPNNEITSDSNIISYEQYLQQMQNVIVQDTNSSAQQDSMIMYVFEQLSEKMSNHITNWEKVNQEIKIVNESLTVELERYKERTLSNQVKEKESLLQTFNVFKKESKEKESKYMDKEIDLKKKIKELDNIIYKVGQSAQTMHMLTKPQVFYDDTHKQALGYQNPFYLKKAHRIKSTPYDGSVISRKHDVISVVDEEETLILEEESQSKMLAKQNDPIMKKQKINTILIDYYKLNKLDEDFRKRFVPQMQLYGEQAFWLPLSNPKYEQLDIIQTPVEIEIPEELPKISLVKTSFQKLKNHLSSFDKVMKVRTTPDAITEGSWDFENGLHNELNEVKTVFNQMEAAVEQCSVDKKYFNIQKKEVSLDNDRLLDHIICLDVMNIVMHANSVLLRIFKINEWQARLDAKDVSIANLRKHIKKLKGKNVVEKDVRLNNPNVIAPGMFKLDLAPLAPKLLNNRDAHINYIKHSREHADILREIVEYARALRPLDSDLDSACMIVQRIQEVLVYVKDTCPRLTKPSEKLVAITPLNKNKKVRFAEATTSTRMKSSTSASRSHPSGNTKHNRILQTTSRNMKNKVEDHPRSVKSKSNKMNRVSESVCNADVKYTSLNANSEFSYVKCNQCMFDANHDVCFLEFDNDVNVHSKSKSAKRSKKKQT
ncbi:hypothetical protein Tco_0045531 [Tanacetum coccineum]